MDASEFYILILKLRSKYKHLEFSDNVILRVAYKGTLISKNQAISLYYSNEIENLLYNYNIILLKFAVKDISFYSDIFKIEQNLFAFAEFDSYLCYDNNELITWNDYDTYECFCEVAINAKIFLDILYIIAESNFHLNLDKKSLRNQLVLVSKVNSNLFFTNLLGLNSDL